MTLQSQALHHQHIRKRIYKNHEEFPHPDKVKRFFDRLIYFAVFAMPIMNIPQLLEIWLNKSAKGVSLVSWIGFAFLSSIWFVYGLLHKEKPIIFMNGSLIFLQLAIVIGIVLYG